MIIPCHRHSDAFYILKEFGYQRDVDYKELEQGFLDEDWDFYNRIDAWHHALIHHQLGVSDDTNKVPLYSEDLW